jgi:elongation factor P
VVVAIYCFFERFSVVSPSDFKKGSTKILWNNEPWIVLDYQLVQPGKGGSYMRTKMKNLITGRILEETFRSGEKLAEPDLERIKAQYLYSSDDLYHFMDQENFDQIDFNKNQIKEVAKHLKESIIYVILFFNGRPINVEPPMFMILEISSTIPGVRGDTAQGGSKPAMLETGLTVNVPLFLNEGDKIKIDTRDNKYIERADS